MCTLRRKTTFEEKGACTQMQGFLFFILTRSVVLAKLASFDQSASVQKLKPHLIPSWSAEKYLLWSRTQEGSWNSVTARHCDRCLCDLASRSGVLQSGVLHLETKEHVACSSSSVTVHQTCSTWQCDTRRNALSTLSCIHELTRACVG